MLTIVPKGEKTTALGLENMFENVHSMLEKAFNFINLRFKPGTPEKEMVEFINGQPNRALVAPEINNTILEASEISKHLFSTFEKTRFKDTSAVLKWGIQRDARKREIKINIGVVFVKKSDPSKELRIIVDEDGKEVTATRNTICVIKTAESVDMDKEPPKDGDVLEIKCYKATLISAIAHHLTIMYLLYSKEYHDHFDDNLNSFMSHNKNANVFKNRRQTYEYLSTFLEKNPRVITIENFENK